MKKAGITEGALFRRIRRGGHVQSERLTDFAAAADYSKAGC